MATLGDMILRVGANIDGFEQAMGTVSQRLNAIDRDANKAFSGIERLGSRLTTLGTTLTAAVTLPLAAAGLAATKFASDFELGMRQVTSLMGGVSKREFDDLSKSTLELSKRLGIDAVKATNALFEAISAGVPKENAIEFLEVASKAAIAGVTDTKVAVDGMTTIINAFGLEMSRAQELSDAMFQAVNIGKFTFEQLASSVGIAAGTAAQLGVDFKELLAAAATITKQGFSVSDAMTQMQAAMKALIVPTDTMKGLFKAIGVESGQALLQTRGFEGALEAVREAADGNATVMAKAFGRIEGFKAVLALTGQNAKMAASDLDELRRSSDGVGAATAAFNEINKSTSRQFEMALNQIKATAIEMGTKLLPTVNTLLQASKPLIDALASMVKWFGELSPSTQTWTLALIATAAAIGPLIAGVGTLIGVVATVGKAFLSWSSITGTLMGPLASLVSATQSVIVAVQAGMVGALTSGEMLLLRFGQAALVAGAAFAGWHLGKWLDENVVRHIGPLNTFVDTLAAFPAWVYDKIAGGSKAAAEAQDQLASSVKQFEERLKAHGVTVERGNMTLEQYAQALRQTAKDAGLLGTAQEKQKAASDGAGKSTAALAEGVQGLGKKVDEAEQKTRRFDSALLDWQVKMGKAAESTAKAKINQEQFNTALSSGALADEANRITNALAGTNRELLKLGQDSAVIKALPNAAKEAARKVEELEGAYKDLGITSRHEIQKTVDQHRQSYETIAAFAGANSREAQRAWVAYQEAAIRAAEEMGERVPSEQKRALEQMKVDLGIATAEQKSGWSDWGKEVSTIITNTAQNMARALFDGDTSFGEKMKAMLKELGMSVVSLFIQPAVDAISKFIVGTLADLLGGKGFGGVLDRIKDIGGAITGVFGGGTGGAVASGAGGAVSATGGAGAANAVSGVAGGLLSSLGSIGSIFAGIGSMGTFIQGLFSQSDKDIGNMERSVAAINNSVSNPDGIADNMKKVRDHLGFLTAIGQTVELHLGELWNIHDTLRKFTGERPNWLSPEDEWPAYMPSLLSALKVPSVSNESSGVFSGAWDKFASVSAAGYDAVAEQVSAGADMIHRALLEVRGAVEDSSSTQVQAIQAAAASREPQVVNHFTISGNTFRDQSDIDYLIEQIGERMQLAGQKI